MKYSLVIVIFLLSLCVAASSCSSIADSAPSSAPSVENVGEFYFPLTSIGTQYMYLRTTSSGNDTIHLQMQGADGQVSASGSSQCFAADIYKDNYFRSDLYFSVNDSEAYTLGGVSCGTSAAVWLDLKAPLAEKQQWQFPIGDQYYFQTVTATVVHRGLTMKMPSGEIFNDVTEVLYVTGESDTTTKWFARGTGLIYTSSNHPDNDFGNQSQFLNRAE